MTGRTYLRVLLLRDDIAGAVGTGLAVQQRPVSGADCLELCMLEQLTVVSLAHNGIDHKS